MIRFHLNLNTLKFIKQRDLYEIHERDNYLINPARLSQRYNSYRLRCVNLCMRTGGLINIYGL